MGEHSTPGPFGDPFSRATFCVLHVWSRNFVKKTVKSLHEVSLKVCAKFHEVLRKLSTNFFQLRSFLSEKSKIIFGNIQRFSKKKSGHTEGRGRGGSSRKYTTQKQRGIELINVYFGMNTSKYILKIKSLLDILRGFRNGF